ncbi:hypothetical protein AS181_22145 [Gordonia sp. SGD-V-85]|nr:hypothetical protein AS181_22145 [Gordonia sp. SGD-V-85]
MTAQAASHPDTVARTRGRAGIYLRVSTAEQAHVGGEVEGYSIPYQREVTRARARDLGLLIHDEYVDAGFSGRDTKRPDFLRLLEDIMAGNVTHVIVHKLDRLGRSKRVDFMIDDALERMNGQLVSIAENIDGTPAGKMQLQTLRGIAHYYSDNLGSEVLKGLTTKHARGGTPGRAPLGYLNKRTIDDLADIRWVDPDPERAPLIQWAFETYASGDWSIANLRDALEDKGLRTRRTPRVPSRPVSIGSLHKILSNPYYAGVVTYRGAYREGKHEPLVPLETWIRVQDILHAHNTAGEKDNKHNHHLRGTIWCSHCGQRMVYSKNKGRGGTYEYYFCMGRKDADNPCPRGFVRLSRIEEGIEDLYRAMSLTTEDATAISETVHGELSAHGKQAELDTSAAKKRLTRAQTEQEKLLAAHYDGAIPLELLKKEMKRLSDVIEAATNQLAISGQGLDELRHRADSAIELAHHCHRLYERARPSERRMLNQGFFTRIYINSDGTVSDAELQQPFVHLLAVDKRTTIQHRQKRLRHAMPEQNESDSGDTSTAHVVSLIPRGQRYHQMQQEHSQTAVLLSFTPRPRQTPVLTFAQGLNDEHLAEPRGFEPLTPSASTATKGIADISISRQTC